MNLKKAGALKIPLVLQSLSFGKAGSSQIMVHGRAANRLPVPTPPLTLTIRLRQENAASGGVVHISIPPIAAGGSRKFSAPTPLRGLELASYTATVRPTPESPAWREALARLGPAGK